MLTALLFTAAIASCQKKEKLYTKGEMQRKADSAIQLRIKTIKDQMSEDLETRSAIEVKPKADSILQAKGVK